MVDVLFDTRTEISKKSLLKETGISYGQLYRWKREGLIPEEWFIKRSAFTGQETFFPRERIIGRIKAIQAMRGGKSLSEIRESLESERPVADLRSALLESGETDLAFIDGITGAVCENPLSKKAGFAVTALVAALAETDRTIRKKQELIMQVIAVLSDTDP